MSGVKKSIGIVVLSHNMPGVGTRQGVIGDYKSLDGGLPEMARRSGSVFAVKLSLACEATPPRTGPGSRCQHRRRSSSSDSREWIHSRRVICGTLCLGSTGADSRISGSRRVEANHQRAWRTVPNTQDASAEGVRLAWQYLVTSGLFGFTRLLGRTRTGDVRRRWPRRSSVPTRMDKQRC